MDTMKYMRVSLAVILIFGIVFVFRFMEAKKGNQSTMNVLSSENSMQPVDRSPKMTIDTGKTYTAVLHTDKGDITIDLHAADTPVTVNNFVHLSQTGFYDKTIFHRVIDGFMIQGGDPKGTGSGGPGYSFDDEPFSGTYKRGTVAMANSGPNTNGSQFFIMHANYDLPKNYVIFGSVIAGMDVVDAIATAPVAESLSGESSKPVNPVHISSVDIAEK